MSDLDSKNTWLSLARAAAILDISPDALRKRCERLAKPGPNGMIVCPLQDGIEARKLGKLWKLRLPGWR